GQPLGAWLSLLGPPLPRHPTFRYLSANSALGTWLGTGDPVGANQDWILYGRKAVLHVQHHRVPALSSLRIVGQVSPGTYHLLHITHQELAASGADQSRRLAEPVVRQADHEKNMAAVITCQVERQLQESLCRLYLGHHCQ